MNAHKGDGEFKPTRDFGEFSSRTLSEQLDDLALEEDDDDDDPCDPMNISDFLNSKGDLTGLSEWTDSEHEELEELTKHNHPDISTMFADKTAVPTPLTSTSTTNPKPPQTTPRSPVNTTTLSPCCKSNHNHRDHPSNSTQTPPVPAHSSIKTPGTSQGPTKTGQIFIRAPNFRTPGGYKPPLIEKEPRNLTDEQLLQEVKEMYAEDRLQNGSESDVPDSADQDKDSLEFLLKGLQVDQIADVKSSKANDSLPVEEHLVTKSKAWICNNEDPVSQDSLAKVFSDSSKIITSVINTPLVSSGRRSPNTRKDNLAELSRLWDEIQDTKQRLEHDMSSLINPVSPDTSGTVEDNSRRQLSPKPPSPPQSNSVRTPTRRIVSVGKRAFVPEPPAAPAVINSFKSGEGGDNAEGETQKSAGKGMPKRNVRRTKGKQRQWRHGAASSAMVPIKPPLRVSDTEDELGLNQDDVNEILEETDIQESELDDLLSEISDYVPDVGVSEISNFFDHPDFRRGDGNPEQEGYKQKYLEERYRRDHCENEISRLQKELLEVNEKVSVSDGIIRGKEATITRLNKVYQRVQIQWKSHEKGCKEELTQIKTHNAQLRGRLGESKERISAYEEELERAIGVSESFKEKVQVALEDLELERVEGREQKQGLERQINSLTSSLTTVQAEKESALRALGDCQESLDVTKKSLADATGEVRTMSLVQKEHAGKLQGLVTENQVLKSQVTELSSKCGSLEGEVAQLKEENVSLESEFRRKLEGEREKLHDYYNTKIKEILHAESEKMIEAERVFVKLHDQKLEEMQAEGEERVDNMRSKFTQQVQQMQSKFETQLNSLKKENDEQARLIGTVSQQLRNFSRRDEQPEQDKRHVDDTLAGTSCISSLVDALSGGRGWIDRPQPQPASNGKAPTS